MSRANESRMNLSSGNISIYFTCTFDSTRNYIVTSFLSQREMPLSYRVAIARLIVCTYIHTLIVHATKRRGREWPVNVPSVTSSLRLHTQTEELGPDTLRCIFDRGRGRRRGSFAPGSSALLSSRVGYCRRNTSEQSNNIARNLTNPPGLSLGEETNKCQKFDGSLDFFR